MFREAAVNNLASIPFLKCVCWLNDTTYVHIHKYFFKTRYLSMVLGVLELQARNAYVSALSQLFLESNIRTKELRW